MILSLREQFSKTFTKSLELCSNKDTPYYQLIHSQLLSQPNNNTKANNKPTITVLGLRQSNHWKPTTHHHPPPPGIQNYMIEQKYSKTQKIKVICLYEETPKQFLNPTQPQK